MIESRRSNRNENPVKPHYTLVHFVEENNYAVRETKEILTLCSEETLVPNSIIDYPWVYPKGEKGIFKGKIIQLGNSLADLHTLGDRLTEANSAEEDEDEGDDLEPIPPPEVLLHNYCCASCTVNLVYNPMMLIQKILPLIGVIRQGLSVA